jgi:two-component system, NtrC family, sensor histidine kinase HydH
LTVSLLYLPHVLFVWEESLSLDIERVCEMILYNLIGGVTGGLVQQQMRIQRQYKQTAEKLETAYTQLQEQIDLRLQTEEQLREVDRLATLGELAAHLAHEIGNPLGSIKGAAEILCDDYSEDDSKYEFAQILLKEIQRLDDAVRDFLEFGKHKPLRLVPADLNGLIRTATQFVAVQCARQNITVNLDLNPSLGEMLLDPRKMEQALLNLLLNATASMPDGGTLHIRTQPETETGLAKIEISDTGTGIPKSELNQIFEPFFTTRADGTGLGLAIVHRIITGHQGRIWVESAEGAGTKFTIRIPMNGKEA